MYENTDVLLPYLGLMDYFFKDAFPYLEMFPGGVDQSKIRRQFYKAVYDQIIRFDEEKELTYSRFGNPHCPRNPKAQKAQKDLLRKQINSDAVLNEAKLKLAKQTMKKFAYAYDRAGIPVDDKRIATHFPSHRDLINKKLPAKAIFLFGQGQDDLMNELARETVKGLRDFDHMAAFTSSFADEEKRLKREAEKRKKDPSILLHEAEKKWIYQKCEWHIRRLQYKAHPDQSGCRSKLSLDAIYAKNLKPFDDLDDENENSEIYHLEMNFDFGQSHQIEADFRLLSEISLLESTDVIRTAFLSLPKARREALREFLISKKKTQETIQHFAGEVS